MTTDYDALIWEAATRYGIDPVLLTALVLVESSGRTDGFRYESNVAAWFGTHPRAKGLAPRRAFSSYGLCQVLYATATDYGFDLTPEWLFQPEVGVDYGAKILSSHLVWAKGDERKALAAYNAGRGNIKAGIPYATKVLARRLTI